MQQYQGVSTLEVLEEAKNYNKWIAENFLPHLVSPVLEIGAGTGNITHHFQCTEELFISDNDRDLLKLLEKKFQKNKNIKKIHLDITKPVPVKYEKYFSAIVGINVLEHIADDAKALKNLRRMLKKNGKLILLVPAKKIAYTKLDREVGHFRRYEKNELIEKIRASGYMIETIYFFNIVGLVSWIVRDKIGKSPHLKPYHIAIFDMIVPFLKRIEKIRKPVIGISLVVVARNSL